MFFVTFYIRAICAKRRCCYFLHVPQGLGGRAHHSCRHRWPTAVVNGGFNPRLDRRAAEKGHEAGRYVS